MLALKGPACKGMMFLTVRKATLMIPIMIVPEFWAEARIQKRFDDRQITVRRFGWSDTSQEDAQASAEARTQEAFDRILAGEHIDRREHKVAYNGADGVPIREQIIVKHGSMVITRNLYGAYCLNTPSVLFADIDVVPHTPFKLSCISFIALLGLAAAWGQSSGSIELTVIALMVALTIGYPLSSWVYRLFQQSKGGPREHAHQRIRQFATAHPDWHLRVYETPAGFRVLVMHRTFDPREEMVDTFFDALETDPVYARMCQNQNCFRARVSPKPWRIGMHKRIRPSPGVWPVKPEYMPDRERWTTEYEEKARGYASCRFVEALGHAAPHPEAQAVQKVHDELSRAHIELPLA
jgi:hypothetical protein